MNACARIPHPLGELISTLNVGFNALISFSGLLHFQPLAQKSSTVMQSKDGFSDRRTAALGRFRSFQLALMAWKSVYGKWHFYCARRGNFASTDANRGRGTAFRRQNNASEV